MVPSEELDPDLDEPVLDIPETQGDWTMESWDGEQEGGSIDGVLEVASDTSSVVSDEVLLQTNLGDDFLSLFAMHPTQSQQQQQQQQQLHQQQQQQQQQQAQQQQQQQQQQAQFPQSPKGATRGGGVW